MSIDSAATIDSSTIASAYARKFTNFYPPSSEEVTPGLLRRKINASVDTRSLTEGQFSQARGIARNIEASERHERAPSRPHGLLEAHDLPEASVTLPKGAAYGIAAREWMYQKLEDTVKLAKDHLLPAEHRDPSSFISPDLEQLLNHPTLIQDLKEGFSQLNEATEHAEHLNPIAVARKERRSYLPDQHSLDDFALDSDIRLLHLVEDASTALQASPPDDDETLHRTVQSLLSKYEDLVAWRAEEFRNI